MHNACSEPAELLQAALETATRPGNEVRPPQLRCMVCSEEVEGLRHVIGVLRRTPAPRASSPGTCLDEADIARWVDGDMAQLAPQAVTHVASCGFCRNRLAFVAHLVGDKEITTEVDRLEQAEQVTKPRPGRWGLRAGLAAAALAALALLPQLWRRTGPAVGADGGGLRDAVITTTPAPEIVGPLGWASPADSLRWTSVPRADLYRVTLWDQTGATIWQGQTRDTVLALPREAARQGEAGVLWEVRARTGWDRWVTSDLAQLRLHQLRPQDPEGPAR